MSCKFIAVTAASTLPAGMAWVSWSCTACTLPSRSNSAFSASALTRNGGFCEYTLPVGPTAADSTSVNQPPTATMSMTVWPVLIPKNCTLSIGLRAASRALFSAGREGAASAVLMRVTCSSCACATCARTAASANVSQSCSRCRVLITVLLGFEPADAPALSIAFEVVLAELPTLIGPAVLFPVVDEADLPHELLEARQL